MNHEKYMQAALDAGRKGFGRTRPNPPVGSVIVKDDQIVGTGFHVKPGEDHGEIAAIKNATETDGAVMYVTLEPCCTHGRTPPCTEAILKSGIRHVVVGTLDTRAEVSGRGIEILRQGGIEVTLGVLERECRLLNRGYLANVEWGRPWIAGKYAMSIDGKIATSSGDSRWISNEKSRARVAELRNSFDAVWVGTDTLVLDNPRLTARVENGRNPARILIDRTLRAPLTHNAYDGAEETFLFTDENAPAEKLQTLVERGIVVDQTSFVAGVLDVGKATTFLGTRGIGTILCEGGGRLLGSLTSKGLLDEVYAFISPKLFGGAAREPFVSAGPETMEDVAHLTDVRVEMFDNDVLVHGFWPR